MCNTYYIQKLHAYRRSRARERKQEGEKDKFGGKMIYRKWSLLTGPTSLFVGIIGAVVAADLLFIENDWVRKTYQKKPEPSTSTK